MAPLTDNAILSYSARNDVLAKLGFSSYKAYLASSLWKSIRLNVLFPSSRCRACGKKATQIHHNRYALTDMNGKCLDHLIPVCGGCHRRCEFTKIGLKVSPHEATARLDTMRVINQERWKGDDRRDTWKHFFTVLTEVRIYLGMDPSEEARTLVEKLDNARHALPKKPRTSLRRKKRLPVLA